MEQICMNEKPTTDDFAYVYVEDVDGKLVRIPKAKIFERIGDGLVTLESIENALGYTPANADDVNSLNTKIFSVNPSKSFLRSSSQKASGTIEISMSGDTGYIDFYLSATKIIRISATENSLDYWILNNGQIVKGTNAANFS